MLFEVVWGKKLENWERICFESNFLSKNLDTETPIPQKDPNSGASPDFWSAIRRYFFAQGSFHGATHLNTVGGSMSTC